MRTDLVERGSIGELRELIGEMKYALITSRRADGSLHTCPLITLDWLFDGVAWFLVSRSSRIGQELTEECDVSLAYATPDRQVFVSLSGRARIIHAPDHAGQLWNLWASVFFPAGPEDPDVGVLRVDVRSAEYWTGPDALLGRIPLRGLVEKDASGLGHHARIDRFYHQSEEALMPQGDKSAYTDKQKRKARHIEEGYEREGVPTDEAERRAWATVNKQDGGGKKSGSGRRRASPHKSSRQDRSSARN